MSWWKVAMHLDEAQLALANVMVHNVDDPRPLHALHDRLREGQAILLQIFHAKGLLPGSTNGRIETPMPEMPMVGGLVSMDIAQSPPFAAKEPAVPEAPAIAVASEPEQPASVASPEAVAPSAIASEDPSEDPSEAPPVDPGAGGAGG